MSEPDTAGPCFHGGAFFDAIGDQFDALPRAAEIVNADVLDAWFPPAPGVLEAIQPHLPWILRTSPPTDCGGMVRVIAATRGVDESCVLPGAGSSTLIFLAFSRWLTPDSRVLLLDPAYGEYAHVLEQVVGCRVERFTTARAAGYAIDLQDLAAALRSGFDLVVLVNPNSPTGRFVPPDELGGVLAQAPPATRVWVDETYVDYAGPNQSLERFAVERDNVVVCKSMSKVYALSGVRAAYLCAAASGLESLRRWVPPWAVSLPAQIAAVRALQDPAYYAARYRETAVLRETLAGQLRRTEGVAELVPGIANFILCHLDPAGPAAAQVVDRCREHGVFLRDAGGMGTRLGAHALRLAVKDATTNGRILEVLGAALRR